MAKSIIYWDACIFYEWLGKENVTREKRDGINEVIQDNENGNNTIITSIATHLEVLPEKLNEKDVEAEAAYLNLFDAEKFCEIQITTNTVLLAREIRDYYYRPSIAETLSNPRKSAKMMDLGDAIHLATAIIEGANVFHTRDDDDKGTKIPLLSLYMMYNQTMICGKYELSIISPIAEQGTLDVD